MNCFQVRTNLPVFVYGDLKPEEMAAVEHHLTTCPACRREQTDLERVRGALATVPMPAVEVDLNQIFRGAADRQVRRTRLWRRTAFALGVTAAALLVAVALRLEVRMGPSELVVRWGPAEKNEPNRRREAEPAVVNVDRSPSRMPPDLERRLRVMDDLIHALADDLQNRDHKYDLVLAKMRASVDALDSQANRQWSETERNVAALYAAHTILTKKGRGP